MVVRPRNTKPDAVKISKFNSRGKAPNGAIRKPSVEVAFDDEDAELINMPVIRLDPSKPFPLAIGLCLSVTPCINGLFIMWLTSTEASTTLPTQMLSLIAWHFWAWVIAIEPRPMTTPRGLFWNMSMLIGGVYFADKFDNILIRTQYVMATYMFAFARGNVLVHDDYLSSLPVSYRGGYLFNFLDLGKARYFKSEEEFAKYKVGLRDKFAFSLTGIAGTVGGLYILKQIDLGSPDLRDHPALLVLWFGKECAKVLLGGLNFMFGIYLGDAIYTVPLFAFSESATSTLLVQPLMIKPWRSKTLREFWSARWDTGIQSLLYSNAYRPVRKLGMSKAMATLAAFAFSGVIHVPMIRELGGTNEEMFMMFMFFISQCALLFVEDVALEAGLIEPHRMRTLFLVCLSSPLFVYPVLRRMQLD